MSDGTQISWADATWSPVTGCTKVSDGCVNCYIERTPPFRMAHRRFDRDGIGGTTGVQLHPERLDIPLRWRKPRLIFVCSLADLFHDDVPEHHIGAVFNTIASAPQHIFQILTKRPARMRSLLTRWATQVPDDLPQYKAAFRSQGMQWAMVKQWPLPNVWLGVSVEDQAATRRIADLRATPAAVRFVSCEPLLSYVDLDLIRYYEADCRNCSGIPSPAHLPSCGVEPGEGWGIDWVIVGGESGPGARPMHPNWARGLRDQCQEAGVAFHFKQRGEWTWNEPGQFRLPTKPFTNRVAVMHGAGMTAMTKGNSFDPFERGHPDWATRIERVGKKRAGRELDGREWNEYPQQAVTV
jgi:protein gp37